MNWAIIGYGNIAKNFQKTLKLFNGNYLKAIITKQNLKLNIETSSNIKNLKFIEDINAVYISNFNNMHFTSSMECIDLNKPFIVEKPSINSLKDFSNLKNKILEKEILFYEGYMNLHYPLFNTCVDLIKNNEIGKVKKIDSSIGFSIKKKFLGINYYLLKKTHRLRDPLKFGGAINDVGCYAVSFLNKLLYLLYPKINFEKNFFFKKSIFGSTNVDEHSECKIFFNDIKACLKCSIIKDLESKISIYGNQGSIFINEPWILNKNSFLELKNNKGTKRFNFDILPTHFYLIKNFNNSYNNIKHRKSIILENLFLMENNIYLIEQWRNNN